MDRWKIIVFGIIVFLALAMVIVTMGVKFQFLPPLPLSGVEVKQEFPKISLKTFWEGKWQADIERWLSSNLGLRALFVRLDNQMNYSIFDEIPLKYWPSIRLGKNKWLYETGYINTYNKLDAVPQATLEERVKSIKKLQTLLESKGIFFLFLISPSKAGIYPEYIKDKDLVYTAAALKTNYEKILPLLKQYQVHYLDGRQFLMTLKEKSPHPLFTKGGTHWNYYAAYYFTAELISSLEKMTNKKMTKIHCNYIREDNMPLKDEADLANLTNMIFTKTFYDIRYYHPETFISENTKNVFRPKMLFIGDSFTEQIFYYLDKYNVYSERDLYYYYAKHFRYPGGAEQPLDPIDKQSQNLSRRILSQDIVIIEASEAALPNIGFGFIEDSLKAFDDPIVRPVQK